VRNPDLSRHTQGSRWWTCHAGGEAPFRVSGIDLDLAAGSFTVVRGSVGSGMTTLLRALVGLLTPIEGMVWWDGREVADLASSHDFPRAARTWRRPRAC
ncbi:MAG: ATP-binding cassette domain-containing protein, partial [Egibacteraceae bacterium]